MRAVVVLLVLVAALVGAVLWLAFREPGSAPVQPVRTGTVARGTTAPPAQKRRREAGRSAWARRGTGVLVGRVHEYGTDRPLPGVEVVLEAGVPGPNQLLTARTGADGAFAFPEVTNFDDWLLRVKAPAPLSDLQLAGLVVVEGRATDAGVLYLAPAFAVPGVVVDDRGDPVPGATVRAVRARPKGSQMDILRLVRELPSPAAAVDSAETGPDGTFRLTKVPPGSYDFLTQKPGFQNSVEHGVLVTPDAAGRTLRLLIAKGFRLQGRVVRASGGPVAGLRVVAFQQPRGGFDLTVLDKSFATADDVGAFDLDGLGAGRYVVAVLPEGEPFSVSDDVEVPAQTFVELVIEGDAWLEGRVTGADDRPVAGAQVFAAGVEGKRWVANVATGADGRYAIRGIRSGPVQIFLVQAEGYGTWPTDLLRSFVNPRGPALVLQPGRNEKDVKLELGATVRGVVIEQGTERTIEGARVLVGSGTLLFGGGRAATTGADGRFEIPGVSAGPSVLLVSKDGWYQPGVGRQTMGALFAPRTSAGAPTTDPGTGALVVIADPGQVVERTLELARGSSVSGRVLNPADEPVAGAQVSLIPEGPGFMRDLAQILPLAEPRLTDAEGRYDLPGPPPGQRVRVVAKAPGWLEGRSEPVAPKAGDALAGLDVRLRQGASLEGTVTDEGGRPIEGALVRWLAREGGEETAIGWRIRRALPSATDAAGFFRVQNVEIGKLAVQVAHPRYLSWSAAEVATEEAKATRLDVTLRQGLVIEGRVLGPDGRPAARARVGVSLRGARPAGADPWAPTSTEASIDAAGNFRAEGLLPGTYRLQAGAEGAAPSEEVEVAAGGPAVTLRLAEAFSISGMVRLRGSGGVAECEVAVVRPATEGTAEQRVGTDRTNVAGEFEVRGVPAGTYDVRVTPAWSMSGGRVNVLGTTVHEVRAGRQGLVIEVEPGLVISGTVFLDTGEPASAGACSAQRQFAEGEPPEGATTGWGAIQDGRFEIPGLAAGNWRVTFNVPGRPQRTIVAKAGTRDVRVDLGAGGGIRGRVTRPDGSSVVGARVNASGEGAAAAARTDDAGRYEIAGLAPGTWQVTAWFQEGGFPYNGRVEGVIVRDGATTDVADVACQRVESPPR